ncbi:hypothetical protein ADUPG1_006907 [Aduncisulcus paluster]|uniref:Uncharacterized protein n=1 Tax=Aduncisulcus paluster TaxID=2918883 RepID=A0ABQ5KK04_9EUKA|nr:hypothetical protein ADUPG1_006907 [Aduncisulcus paluster]
MLESYRLGCESAKRTAVPDHSWYHTKRIEFKFEPILDLPMCVAPHLYDSFVNTIQHSKALGIIRFSKHIQEQIERNTDCYKFVNGYTFPFLEIGPRKEILPISLELTLPTKPKNSYIYKGRCIDPDESSVVVVHPPGQSDHSTSSKGGEMRVEPESLRYSSNIEKELSSQPFPHHVNASGDRPSIQHPLSAPSSFSSDPQSIRSRSYHHLDHHFQQHGRSHMPSHPSLIHSSSISARTRVPMHSSSSLDGRAHISHSESVDRLYYDHSSPTGDRHISGPEKSEIRRSFSSHGYQQTPYSSSSGGYPSGGQQAPQPSVRIHMHPQPVAPTPISSCPQQQESQSHHSLSSPSTSSVHSSSNSESTPTFSGLSSGATVPQLRNHSSSMSSHPHPALYGRQPMFPEFKEPFSFDGYPPIAMDSLPTGWIPYADLQSPHREIYSARRQATNVPLQHTTSQGAYVTSTSASSPSSGSAAGGVSSARVSGSGSSSSMQTTASVQHPPPSTSSVSGHTPDGGMNITSYDSIPHLSAYSMAQLSRFRDLQMQQSDGVSRRSPSLTARSSNPASTRSIASSALSSAPSSVRGHPSAMLHGHLEYGPPSVPLSHSADLTSDGFHVPSHLSHPRFDSSGCDEDELALHIASIGVSSNPPPGSMAGNRSGAVTHSAVSNRHMLIHPEHRGSFSCEPRSVSPSLSNPALLHPSQGFALRRFSSDATSSFTSAYSHSMAPQPPHQGHGSSLSSSDPSEAQHQHHYISSDHQHKPISPSDTAAVQKHVGNSQLSAGSSSLHPSSGQAQSHSHHSGISKQPFESPDKYSSVHQHGKVYVSPHQAQTSHSSASSQTSLSVPEGNPAFSFMYHDSSHTTDYPPISAHRPPPHGSTSAPSSYSSVSHEGIHLDSAQPTGMSRVAQQQHWPPHLPSHHFQHYHREGEELDFTLPSLPLWSKTTPHTSHATTEESGVTVSSMTSSSLSDE